VVWLFEKPFGRVGAEFVVVLRRQSRGDNVFIQESGIDVASARRRRLQHAVRRRKPIASQPA
jgi:hypothetical protein